MQLTEPYDAAVIDIMLPQLDRPALIDEMRRNKVHTPVIVVSAKGSVDDRIEGVQAGGDDHLVNPFAILSRIIGLFNGRIFNIWRDPNHGKTPTYLHCGFGAVFMFLHCRGLARGT